MALLDLDKLPPVQQEWIRQLLTFPNLAAMIESGGPVEVRLFTARGQVRKEPVVVLNASSSPMVNP